MSQRNKYQKERNQIESIAETKCIDLDGIEVIEGETDTGDEQITFRAYETQAETEKESVGVQIVKVPSVQTGDMAFRNDVQNKLGALKRHLTGDSDDGDTEQDASSETTAEESQSTPSQSQSSRTRTRTQSSTTGPGSQLDTEIEELHDRIDEIDDRIETLEEKSDALDGLQQLMQSQNNE